MVETTGHAENERREGGGLSGRLRFAGLDADHADLLRAHRNQLLPHVRTAVRDFIGRVQAFPEASRHFISEAQLDRLHDLQVSHWDVLTDARFDSLYAERVKVLTDCETRMGLEPRWHLSAHSIVLEHILCGAIADFWPKGLLGKGSRQRDELLELVRSIIRTVMVDVEIATSLRFNEARLTYQRNLADAVEARRSAVREIIQGIADKLQAGDLTPPDAALHADDQAEAVENLRAAMATVAATLERAGEAVSRSQEISGKVSGSAVETAGKSRKSSGELLAAALALADLARTASTTAEGAEAAEQASERARKAAAESGEIVGRAMSAMSDIEKSAERIGQIIGVIDDIAFQTNLLALNAGIEAARAGETGRGFAVVAQEVRALAQRSAEAAHQIKDLVTTTKTQVDGGVQMVERTHSAISEIGDQISAVGAAISELARGTGETAKGASAISATVETIGRDVASEAADVGQISGTVDELRDVILELGATIRSFRITVNSESTAAPVPSKAVARSASASQPPVIDYGRTVESRALEYAPEAIFAQRDERMAS